MRKEKISLLSYASGRQCSEYNANAAKTSKKSIIIHCAKRALFPVLEYVIIHTDSTAHCCMEAKWEASHGLALMKSCLPLYRHPSVTQWTSTKAILHTRLGYAMRDTEVFSLNPL